MRSWEKNLKRILRFWEHPHLGRRKKGGSKRIWDKVIRNMWKSRSWLSRRGVEDLSCYKPVKHEGKVINCLSSLWSGDHG